MQKARWMTLAILVAPALAAVACGGDDSSGDPADAGGAAGSSGTGAGGAGGSGGSNDAGTGGSAGKGGSGTAGAAGTGAAGKGGSAGGAMDGGTAGKAGAGGSAGSAGSAGASGAAGKGGTAGTTSDGGPDGIVVVDATPDGTNDARVDTSSDAPIGDGGTACSTGPAMGRTCTNYCSDWFSTCQPIPMWSTTYANPTACLTDCSTWADAKLCCRAEHVQNAVNAPNMNQTSNQCGQAVGDGGPSACNN